MLDCQEFYEILKSEEINFFTGVPDSTFKSWMKFLADEHGKGLTNIKSCNECEAIALASGYYLATGKLGVVYLQNAGLGKTVNPLTSLTDPEVYSIPLILMIGWRGKPGEDDEPQHKKMGRITIPLLQTLEIPYLELPDNREEASLMITKAKKIALELKAPFALIVKKNTFSEYDSKIIIKQNFEMTRECAIKTIIDEMKRDEIIISTTGKTSRELFEYRTFKQQGHANDFLTVGSMGCSSSIALGIALQKKEKNVFVFDGDGAVIMQEGSLSTIGHYAPENLYHIIFDNQVYDSTGGQPTVSTTVDFEKLSLANGYINSKTVFTKNELISTIKELEFKKGPMMIIVKVNKGARKTLGRPTTTPIQNKNTFMDFLSQ